MNSILNVIDLAKVYRGPNGDLAVLQDVDFEISAGTTTAIVGPSGSGKTTLLGLCAGLDECTIGTVTLAGFSLDRLSEHRRAKVRNENIGFVFQNFQLIPTLTALENVALPLELMGRNAAAAEDWLDRVGLSPRRHHFPFQLSGGEQQRVAIARAFVSQPKIVFCDEPTGNLDAETGQAIADLMFSMNRNHGTALVIVTHDADLAARCQRVIRLKGGRIVSDIDSASTEVPASDAVLR